MASDMEYTEVIQLEGVDTAFEGMNIGPFKCVKVDNLRNKDLFECLCKANIRYYIRKRSGERQDPYRMCLISDVDIPSEFSQNKLETDIYVVQMVINLLTDGFHDACVVSASLFDRNQVDERHRRGDRLPQINFMDVSAPLKRSDVMLQEDKITLLYQLVEENYTNPQDPKKQSFLVMFLSSLYIQARNPRFITMVIMLDMLRCPKGSNITERIAKITATILSDLGTNVYGTVKRIYDARSDYVHQGIGRNISINFDITYKYCVRLVWKLMRKDVSLSGIEDQISNGVFISKYFWERMNDHYKNKGK